MNQKSVYQDNKISSLAWVIFLSALMIGFSLYLTQHYFDVKFPNGLEGKSLCNINSFFNCDKTTMSGISNIFNVPISILGAIVGMLTFMGVIVKNEDFERTIFFMLIANFVGCVLLFIFSLIVLKGLCPFCTLYYIASGATLYLFYKRSNNFKPAPGFLISFGLVFIVTIFLMKGNVDKKIANQQSVASDLIKQFYSLPNLGEPKIHSEYKIIDNPNAPIKIQIFSDFECPACKMLSEEIPQILNRYEGKIHIEYFFHPLDNNCNPNMQRALHQYACKAAYAASCMPTKDFPKIHDEMFLNQENFEKGFVDQFIKKNNIANCVNDPKTKDKVVSLVTASNPFNVRSTPTYLINGVKIEGVLPADQIFSILDEIVKRSTK